VVRISELNRVFDVGEQAPSLAEKQQIVQQLCLQSPEVASAVMNMLVENTDRGRRSLIDARDSIQQLQTALEKLTSPPWRVARFLRVAATSHGDFAQVRCGGAEHLVSVGDGVLLESLEIGDVVFVTGDMTAIVERSNDCTLQAGETAIFDHFVASSNQTRALIKYRDEDIVADIVGPLKGVDLKGGDLVLLDRASFTICEKLQSAAISSSLLVDTPDIPISAVGGQERCLQELLWALTISLVAPDICSRYRLGAHDTVLLVGPPGCGKTLMARVAAAEIGRLSNKKCKFAVVKPGQWESMYVGDTEQNIRNFFKGLRESAKDGCAVAFFDEIESIGRIRGGVSGHHADRFLAAFLAELQGFESRGQLALVSATNRKDLVDPALLSRISDVEIQVGRPDMRGARAIFDIHMPDSMPYRSNGHSPSDSREAIIETMVSQLYSPNGNNDLCTLRFGEYN
jgi:proteasome-associated ATPase